MDGIFILLGGNSKMSYSESFLLKLATIPIIGIGTIFLSYAGVIGAEPAVAILAALAGFLVGEQNGIRKAGG